jgi:uncharacterized tellurite resistance protein B-like protein
LNGEAEVPSSGDTVRDLQVATTVLLVQILRADLQIHEEEIDTVIEALKQVLGLEHEEAGQLVRVASQRVRSSDALPRAAALLDQYLTRKQRVELVEWLWRVAYADSELLAHEEYLIRKVAGLLTLSTADLIEAKVRAKESV